MAWTAPRTWVVGEVVTAALLNTHLRDNLRYLKGLDGTPDIDNHLRVLGPAGADARLLLQAGGANGVVLIAAPTLEVLHVRRGTATTQPAMVELADGTSDNMALTRGTIRKNSDKVLILWRGGALITTESSAPIDWAPTRITFAGAKGRRGIFYVLGNYLAGPDPDAKVHFHDATSGVNRATVTFGQGSTRAWVASGIFSLANDEGTHEYYIRTEGAAGGQPVEVESAYIEWVDW